MTRSQLATILSTCCFLAASGCSTTREAVALRPDLEHADRMVCDGVPSARPELPESYEIDWQAALVPGDAVSTLGKARAAHDAYVRSVRDRNGVVSAYLVTIEADLFVCSNNMQWWRDYWAKMPEEE